ncbi:MAG: divergent PAP2 family protein [Candidatus Eisenbacteria bacterium]|nr:divergent PAP2 family protein [Candidatus Eisenbacteria bacterium]
MSAKATKPQGAHPVTELLANRVLWCAVLGNLAAGVLKVLFALVMERRFQPLRILETGGMPSTHAATVVALATAVAFVHGLQSTFFALAAIFGAVVIYDAMGIRRAAGRHAELLNELVRELESVVSEGFRPEGLKTLLGHTSSQVLVGGIVGLVVALIAMA